MLNNKIRKFYKDYILLIEKVKNSIKKISDDIEKINQLENEVKFLVKEGNKEVLSKYPIDKKYTILKNDYIAFFEKMKKYLEKLNIKQRDIINNATLRSILNGMNINFSILTSYVKEKILQPIKDAEDIVKEGKQYFKEYETLKKEYEKKFYSMIRDYKNYLSNQGIKTIVSKKVGGFFEEYKKFFKIGVIGLASIFVLPYLMPLIMKNISTAKKLTKEM